MKILRKVLYINRPFTFTFVPKAKAGFQALHVTLSVDYCRKWYIFPSESQILGFFPLSKISLLWRHRHIILNRIYTPVNIQEKQVFLSNFIRYILFHFSIPLHRPTIFSAFNFTFKVTRKSVPCMCNSYNYFMLIILKRQMVCLKKCMFCIILLYNTQLSVLISLFQHFSPSVSSISYQCLYICVTFLVQVLLQFYTILY